MICSTPKIRSRVEESWRVSPLTQLRSRKFPLNHLFDKTHKYISEGGTVLRYNDLDEGLRNRVWQTYVDECRRRGHEVADPDQS